MISRAGHYEPIAREGFVFILPPAILSVASWWIGHPWISLFLLILSVAIALFFRNPERTTPPGKGVVVSPADGRVVEFVENVASEHLQAGPLKRISIFMSLFNTHVNRWPVSGTVRRITHVPGTFLDAREPAASTNNEQNIIVVQTEASAIEVVQVAGKIARRIACWVREGDEVTRGNRFGLIRFGSRLDVILPDEYSFEVEIGTKVRAGETIIARAPTAKN